MHTIFFKTDQWAKKCSKAFLLLLVLCLFLAFQTSTIDVSSDGGYYLANANYLLNGNGYTYGPLDSSTNVKVYERGPIAPLLISMGLFFTPQNLIGPYIVVRLFFVLSILLMVLIGTNLFNNKVGLGVGYLTFFWGFYQERGVLIHLETIFIALLLLSFYFIWNGFSTKKKRYFLISGCFFCLSYLTSEIPIIFLPFPFMLFFLLKEYRNRDIFNGLLLFYISFIIFWLPWFYYLFVHNQWQFILGRTIYVLKFPEN